MFGHKPKARHSSSKIESSYQRLRHDNDCKSGHTKAADDIITRPRTMNNLIVQTELVRHDPLVMFEKTGTD